MRHSPAVLTLASFAILGLSACSGQSVFDIPVGSCASTESFTDVQDGVVESLPLLDCEEPHDLEAFASMDLEGEEFPGDDSITQTADEFCVAEFETFVGVSYDTSEFAVSYFAPTEESWDLSGDREVLCWLVSTEPVTGSQEGAAR